MTRTPHRPTRGRRLAPVATLLLLGVLPIACSTNPSATATPPASTAGPTDGPVSTPVETEGPPTPPGQSNSAFGLIWNSVPESFPVPIDAAEADPLQGPVSGAWSVPVADVNAPALAGFYRDALDELGWAVAVDGPLEDGSYTVASTNGQGCETLTTILPRGDESLITALFGAGCPFR